MYIANTGGLLGLFMGFSVVSLIEIVYFISLRPYCAARNRHRQLTQPNDDNVIRQDDASATSKYIWFIKSATVAKKASHETTGSDAPTKLYRFKDSIWQMAQSATDYVKSKFTGAGEYQVQKVNQQFPYTE